MFYAKLGRSDLNISKMTLGTWLTAGDTLTASALEKVLRAADQIGINAVDTADSYAFGDCERALGAALKEYSSHHFVVMTKCYFSTDRNSPDTPRGLSRKAIFDSAQDSLTRLGIDCIDLLQCHRPDPKITVAETVEAMEELVQQGKIRWWGVSKWPDAKIAEAYATGATHLVSSQELYNLFHREPEKEHLAFCAKKEMGFLAYSPLARGILTGKYHSGVPEDSRAAHAQNKTTVYDLTSEKLAVVDQLALIAKRINCTTAQLALAYLLHISEVSSVLLGISRQQQLQDNARAVDIALSPTDVAQITSLFSSYI